MVPLAGTKLKRLRQGRGWLRRRALLPPTPAPDTRQPLLAWVPDESRQRFALRGCQIIWAKRGADVRPDFNWNATATAMVEYH